MARLVAKLLNYDKTFLKEVVLGDTKDFDSVPLQVIVREGPKKFVYTRFGYQRVCLHPSAWTFNEDLDYTFTKDHEIIEVDLYE